MSFAADKAVWIRRLLLEVGFAIPGVHYIRSRTDDDDDDVFPSVETQTESWIASPYQPHRVRLQRRRPVSPHTRVVVNTSPRSL